MLQHTCIDAQAPVYFAETPLDIVAKLIAGPGQMWVDICLWMVSLEMPQLHQASLSTGLVANHLEDVGQASLCLLHENGRLFDTRYLSITLLMVSITIATISRQSFR